jgi:hypothetical protein
MYGNVRTSLPTILSGVTLEPFIAVSSSPPEAAPHGAGLIDPHDVALCHDLDPKP